MTDLSNRSSPCSSPPARARASAAASCSIRSRTASRSPRTRRATCALPVLDVVAVVRSGDFPLSDMLEQEGCQVTQCAECGARDGSEPRARRRRQRARPGLDRRARRHAARSGALSIQDIVAAARGRRADRRRPSTAASAGIRSASRAAARGAARARRRHRRARGARTPSRRDPRSSNATIPGVLLDVDGASDLATDGREKRRRLMLPLASKPLARRFPALHAACASSATDFVAIGRSFSPRSSCSNLAVLFLTRVRGRRTRRPAELPRAAARALFVPLVLAFGLVAARITGDRRGELLTLPVALWLRRL